MTKKSLYLKHALYIKLYLDLLLPCYDAPYELRHLLADLPKSHFLYLETVEIKKSGAILPLGNVWSDVIALPTDTKSSDFLHFL